MQFGIYYIGFRAPARFLKWSDLGFMNPNQRRQLPATLTLPSSSHHLRRLCWDLLEPYPWFCRYLNYWDHPRADCVGGWRQETAWLEGGEASAQAVTTVQRSELRSGWGWGLWVLVKLRGRSGLWAERPCKEGLRYHPLRTRQHLLCCWVTDVPFCRHSPGSLHFQEVRPGINPINFPALWTCVSRSPLGCPSEGFSLLGLFKSLGSQVAEKHLKTSI